MFLHSTLSELEDLLGVPPPACKRAGGYSHSATSWLS